MRPLFMGTARGSIVGAGAALAVVSMSASAGSVAVSVAGASNIYGAGYGDAPDPGGGGGGVPPNEVPIPCGATHFTLTGVGGEVDYDGAGAIAPNPADGVLFMGGCDIASWRGISGVAGMPARRRNLTGVFLGATEPEIPPPLPQVISDYAFESVAPVLAQQFFVGDGLTGSASGTTQQFIVPGGATRLFLGFADAPGPCGSHPGTYGNNLGAIQLTVVFHGSIEADLNCDGTVDGDDLGTLLGQWGDCPGCAADFNDNGVVDGDDLGELLGAWS